MKKAKGYFIGLGIGLNMFFSEYAYMQNKEEYLKPKWYNVFK